MGRFVCLSDEKFDFISKVMGSYEGIRSRVSDMIRFDMYDIFFFYG